MQAPKCRLCGKRHYGLCEFGEGRRSNAHDAVAHEEHRQGLEESTSAPCPEQVAIAKDRKNLGAAAGVATGPLTNAERQKRYREKLGDEYRKRNRERMRRNRNER